MSDKKPTNAELRKFITRYFNDSELETFCFDYFPEVKQEFTLGMAFGQKAQILIGYCRRRKLDDNLLAALMQERPQVALDYFPSVSKTTREPAPPLPAPRPRNPRQVFVSHAHEDAELAGRLAADLAADGWPVWIAPDSILPGEKWVTAISRGLDESGIFVLLLTPRAVQSRWVRHETDAAVEMEREDEMRFIPLLAEACRVPALWRAYQRIPFRRDYNVGLAALLAALAGEKRSRQTSDVSQTSDVLDTRPARSLRPRRSVPKNSFIHEKTGLEFVQIPAGEFLYGDNKEKKRLPEFWMGKTPVTNMAYKRFLDANPKYSLPHKWDKSSRMYPNGKAEHPVVYVSWHDAKAFCEWARLELPTEEQWEKAARGTDGREYPWGNEQPTRELCNFDRHEGGTTPVGKYSPQGDSPHGCADMSGNVWEWTSSLYKKGEDWRVLRGGSWVSTRYYARAASRLNPAPVYRRSDFGFRVAAARRSPSHHAR